MSGTGRLNKDIYAKQSIKSGIAFHQGDVLYGKLRPYLQNWLLPTFDGLAVGDFWVLQPQNADSSFLYRLIQSRQFDEVANQSTGTKMPRADWKLVSKTVFSIPSNISEQAAIGTYFTALDSLITLHQRECISFTGRADRLILTANKKRTTSSWEQRKLSEITDKVTEKNAGLQYVETFTNSAEFGIISQRDFFDHDIAKLGSLDGYYIVKNEDFVYNPRISTSAPVGPINRNKLGRTGVMSPLYTVFRPHDIDTTYLEYFFKCGYWHSFMNFNGDSGARSDRFSIRDNVFFQMPIPIPDIDEQRKIGELLTCLDNLITLHQRQHFLHSTPDISLSVRLIHPFYTSSWEQRKVSDLAEKTYGGGTPTTSNEAYWNGDIPWIQSSDVVDGKLLGVEPRKWITQDGLNNSAAQLIPGNSIAIITRVGVGKLAFMPYSYATSQDFLSLSKLNAEPLFTVYACYKKLQSELNAVQGTSIKGITKDELLAKNIMVPRYAEQQQIGAFFKQLDHLITLHQRKGKAAVSGCSNDANNSKGVCCKARDFGYKCHKKDEPNRFDA